MRPHARLHAICGPGPDFFARAFATLRAESEHGGGGAVASGLASIDRRSYERAALVCAVVLAALAIWLLARLIWLLVPRGDVALDAGSTRVATADAGAVPAQSIAKWHLFGNTPIASAGPAGASTLAMTLRGTLADRDPERGIAVIDSGARGEIAFRAGEEVAPGVKLARVYPDRIVLSRGGVEETMKLTRDENLRPGDVVRPAQATRRSRGVAATSTSTSGAADASQTVKVAPDMQQTIERLRADPGELAKRVQIVPVVEDGHLSGVRVSAGGDMALINRIGLRAGDIVTAVNGAPVDSIARGQDIVESLRTASSARVTVLRDGKPTEITISLK